MINREMARAVGLAQAGKLRQAVAAMEKLAARAPDAVEVRYNLALMLLQDGRVADALGHLDRILARQPGHAPSLFSKAKALMALDRPAEALPLLERLGPDPETLLALGNALRRLGRLDEAIAAGQRLTALAPGFLPGHLNFCQMLAERGPEHALPALERACALHPRSGELAGMLGHALLRLGRLEEAADRLRHALALDPTLAAARGHLLRAAREMADWDQEEALFAALRADLPALAARTSQLALATQDAIFYPFDGAEIRRVAEAEARFRTGALRPLPRPQAKAPPPLVLGYLSPDFREHATMHLAGDLFACHDRSRVRVTAYSVGPDDGSEWRDRMRRDCDGFRDLSGLTDRAAAEAIRADGVHVLVDMSVYTRHARPDIAALRPAPVQAAWLGLAAPSGAPWIDYVLVDPVLVPPEHRGHFPESLVTLPHSYQANQAWSPPGPPPDRAALGLPDKAMVFCSFNGHRKTDRASFALWMEVLDAVPGSVLWLLAPPEAARRRLEAAAKDPARLVWAPPLPRADHLARLPAADLFLDALVCGAHTTAADSLRMGVPLVTAAGGRLAARVAASALHAVGLPELVAADSAGLRELAVALGRDRPRLAELRARLRAALPTAPLFDNPRFARAIETAAEAMWTRFAAGRKPADIVVGEG